MAPYRRWCAMVVVLLVMGSGVHPASVVAALVPVVNNTVFLPLVSNAAPATSDALIGAAEQQGTISAETALLYRTFAVFGDGRLPAVYRGASDGAFGSSLLAKVAARLPTLSSETQGVLAPFFVPPIYIEAWHPAGSAASTSMRQSPPICGATAPGWAFVDSSGGTTRVWYQTGDLAKATVVSQAAEDAWAALVPLMGAAHAPMSDVGRSCNGGDGRLDVYLLDINAKGFTSRYGFGCEQKPVFVRINRTMDAAGLRGATIHEIMHAIQWTYDVKAFCLDDYTWLLDSTANWAIDYVDPGNNLEHKYLASFLDVPATPLDDMSSTLHPYGASIFPFFLARSGTPAVVSAIWNATTTENSPNGAVNAAVPGGFDQQWPLFARENWNRVPADRYTTWDGIAQQVPEPFHEQVSLPGQVLRYKLDRELPHLTAAYYHFTFPDDTARTVTFYNGLSFQLDERSFTDENGDQATALGWKPTADDAKKGAHIEARIKINGQWQNPEDWTAEPFHNFCRDQQAERLEELVVIVSNSEWQDLSYTLKPAGRAPTLAATNVGCWHWRGNSILTYTNPYEIGSEVTQSAGVVWEKLDYQTEESADGYTLLRGLWFTPMAGTVGIDVDMADMSSGGCSRSGSGNDSAVNLQNRLLINAFTLAGPAHRRYYAEGLSDKTYTISQVCPPDSGGTTTDSLSIGVWLTVGAQHDTDYYSDPARKNLAANGQTIADSVADNVNYAASWRFVAEREP